MLLQSADYVLLYCGYCIMYGMCFIMKQTNIGGGGCRSKKGRVTPALDLLRSRFSVSFTNQMYSLGVISKE